jgi:hypothetical protein
MDRVTRIITIGMLLLLLLMTGCRSIQYVPVDRVHTEYINRTDSIYLKDSVFIHEKKVNDTIFIDRGRVQIKYVSKHDTINKTDTIPIIRTVTITKVVEKNKLYWWQIALMTLGLVTIIYLITKLKK